MRLDVNGDDDVLAEFSLAADAKFAAILETGRDFDIEVAVADAEADGAAESGRQEWDAGLDRKSVV